MATIETTKAKAIQAAKREIRAELGFKRLTSFIEDKKYIGGVKCDCGETSCVTYIGGAGGKFESATVGYCETCGNK